MISNGMPSFMTSPSSSPACPVCKQSAVFERALPGVEIRRVLSGLFGANVPRDVQIADYALHTCTGCGLVFVDPMQAGDDKFYGWITSFDRYQAHARWEWKAVKEQLVRHHAKSMFEVGAGTGKLMAFLADVEGLNCRGIDLSPASAALAREKGFDVQEADLETLDTLLAPSDRFDAIVLSHVLEHVDNPLGIMQILLERLAEGGRLMAAVPYSPMSRELTEWDIMNLPPHHLTRWNAQSLGGLAAALGCRVELHAAAAKSPLKRAIQDTCGDVLGNKHPSTLVRIKTVLTHVSIFKDFLRQHRAREQVNGRPAGDSVLAVFFR